MLTYIYKLTARDINVGCQEKDLKKQIYIYNIIYTQYSIYKYIL